MNYLKLAITTAAMALSVTANAAVISLDWQNSNDNLITRDTTSGLDWLDLSLTNGSSFNQTMTQMGTSGQFNGFRYATTNEVENLWANVGIDLTAGASNGSTGSMQSGIMSMSTFLGNNVNLFDSVNYPYGALGYATNSLTDLTLTRMGAFYYTPDSGNYFEGTGDVIVGSSDISGFSGSYLVRTSPVPLPAAVWLFSSGILGLIAVARRKNHV